MPDVNDDEVLRELHEAIKLADPKDPVGRALLISIDEDQRQPVIMHDVEGPRDMMRRAPKRGTIDVSALGEEAKELLRRLSLLMVPDADGNIASSKDATKDEYWIDNIDWVKDPETLAWASSVLAQLEARRRALVELDKNSGERKRIDQLPDEQKMAAADYARALSAELRDEALAEHVSRMREAKNSLNKTVALTTDIARERMVTGGEIAKQDGFTADEYNKLFGGVENE